jgi:hypothetical protein
VLPNKRKSFFFEKRTKELLLFAPGRRFKWANQAVPVTEKSVLLLERLHPDWKIIGIRRAAPARCLQSICISLKPPAHEGRFQSG